MLLEENRNCNCSCGCENNMTSTIKVVDECSCGVEQGTVLAVNTKNSCPEPTRRVNCEARREMMQEIRCLEFAITELALYLDTHPDDEKALCLHRKYAKELKDCKDKYQKVFGPLTIQYPCNKWRWLEEPWVSFCFGVI